MYRAYVEVISRCLVSNEDVPLRVRDAYAYGITLGELLLKYADRTVQHKPLSTTEGQRVALMTLGTLTEIRGDSINSGHRWPENWKLSTCVGRLLRRNKNAHGCDLMMGCVIETFRKPRGPASAGIF